MIRTINTCEHNVFVSPPNIVSLDAATATEVFPNEQGVRSGELVTRYVQNLTNDYLYISFGLSTPTGNPVCDNISQFHAAIGPYQVFDCFPHRMRVCVWCAIQGSVSAFKLIRRDLQ